MKYWIDTDPGVDDAIAIFLAAKHLGNDILGFSSVQGNFIEPVTAKNIIPESLGNTDDVLIDRVCDKCQNYFGREVENYILTKTPFGFWRTMAGTLNKKGKFPFFDPSQNPKSKGVPDFHSYTDNGFTLNPGDNEQIVESIIANQRQKHSLFYEIGRRDFKVFV